MHVKENPKLAGFSSLFYQYCITNSTEVLFHLKSELLGAQSYSLLFTSEVQKACANIPVLLNNAVTVSSLVFYAQLTITVISEQVLLVLQAQNE